MVKKLMVAVLLALSTMLALSASPIHAASNTLLITDVQTGGATAAEEFVGIANVSGAPLNVQDWRVEYLSAAGNLSSPALAVLSGTIPTGGTLLLAREGFMPAANLHFSNGFSDVGGHVRVRDAQNVVVDMVGWGTATQPEGVAAAAPGKGQPLERKLDTAGAYQDSDNNAADFATTTAELAPIAAPAQVQAAQTLEHGACEGIQLTEILPNPTGTDKAHEFIEIYNPTASNIQLEGCGLEFDQKVFQLSGVLGSNQYRAYDDSQTGIILPNAAGGAVTLITTTAEAVVQYPADMKDNQSWAFVGGTWQASTMPTPHAANQLPAVAAAATGDTELTPCEAGKYRNPETNRCKSLDTAGGDLTPCKAGQIRNPATNRCASALTASSTLTPCSAGQERNPATNRCRSVVAAASTLKPCDPGEERNPETNRCKKAAGATSTSANTSPQNAAAGEPKSNTNYWAMGAVASGALGYGVYEYRTDLRSKFAKLKARLISSSGP